MKTFKIYKNNAGVPGDYMAQYDAEQMDDSSANRSHLLAAPNALHYELPDGANSKYSAPELIADVWTRGGEDDSATEVKFSVETWTKDGEDDVTTDPEDVSWEQHDADSVDARWVKTDEHYGLVEDLSTELADKKPARLAAIDTKTSELVLEGATYDSETFSLSLNAQTNWAALKTLQALLTWPVNISTKDDYEYSLEESDLDAFAGAMMVVVQGHLDTGRTLKVAIKDATDMTELDAVVDNR